MKSFTEYVAEREDIALSFIFIGQNADLLSENEGEIMNHPKAQSAIGLVRKLAAGIKDSVGTAVDFIKSLAGMPPEKAVEYAKAQLARVQAEFEPIYNKLKAQAEGQPNEGVLSFLGQGLGLLRRGAEFLIKRIVMPVLSTVLGTIKKTASHIIGSTWGAGRSMGIQGYLGMFIAIALTVALWPVFASVAMLATGSVGSTWAVGGVGMAVWAVFLLVAWFKANVMAPALASAEGIHPPKTLRYGM